MLLVMKTRNQQLVRFDQSIIKVKHSSIVSQIVFSPVVPSTDERLAFIVINVITEINF